MSGYIRTLFIRNRFLNYRLRSQIIKYKYSNVSYLNKSALRCGQATDSTHPHILQPGECKHS